MVCLISKHFIFRGCLGGGEVNIHILYFGGTVGAGALVSLFPWTKRLIAGTLSSNQTPFPLEL